MSFKYDVVIDGKRYPIQLGSITNRNLEEALDGGKLLLKLLNVDKPFEMFSLLEFTATDNVDIRRKNFKFLIISDEAPTLTKYNYYQHDLTVIEYSAKLDQYIMSAFAFSKDMMTAKEAHYRYIQRRNEHQGSTPILFNYAVSNGYRIQYQNYFWVEKPFIPEIVYEKLHIKKTKKAVAWFRSSGFEQYIKFSADVYIKFGNERYILSDNDAIITLPLGIQKIKVGFVNKEWDGVTTDYDFDVYEFTVDVRESYEDTLYEVVMNIRDLLSSYGGIESKKHFERTRLFNLSLKDIDYLKSIKAPQIYIPSATARQQLMFIFSYINALPRLIHGEVIDTLELEFYGEKTSNYNKVNVEGNYKEQNTNQIGVKSVAELHNIIPNDLTEPTTHMPYQNGFQTVRSTTTQLTDTNFELKLPSDKPLYKPISLKVLMPISVHRFINGETNPPIITNENVLIDLTNSLITKNEWDLKLISTNFPNVHYTRAYIEEIGLGLYKMENLYWEEGATSIKLSEVGGSVFQSTLLESVILYNYNKYLTENNFVFQELNVGTIPDEVYLQYNFNDALWFKDVKFMFEYITNENMMIIKQDKEDLLQTSNYSEIRYNQDENTISLSRSSAKIYGDLQRIGNVVDVYDRYHTRLVDVLEVGMTDEKGNTISNVKLQYTNHYIKATYTTVKYYNRISQSTFIDQTYRWRDNYASELRNRQDYYDDYVLLIPSDYVEPNPEIRLIDDETKISDRKYQNDEIPYVLRVLFGIIGHNHPFDKTKATTALIRTNGSINIDGQRDTIDDFTFITTPLSSAGYKGGMNFKFGFKDNQVAGDRLKKIDNNYYNSPVIYTDKNARFRYLDMYILNKLSENLENDLDRMPVISLQNFWATTTLNNDRTAPTDNLLYFKTGNELVRHDNADDSFIVNKDPMSNYAMNYNLKVISHVLNDFIIGRMFFERNNLVSNKYVNEDVYLFFYIDGTQYDIFEDLKIKETYEGAVNLRNYDIVKLEKINDRVRLKIDWQETPFEDLITSWAIGNANGDLYLASNKKVKDIDVIRTHIRPGIKVIGQQIPFVIDVDTMFNINANVSYGIMAKRYFEGKIDVSMLITNEIAFAQNYDLDILYDSVLDYEILNPYDFNEFMALDIEIQEKGYMGYLYDLQMELKDTLHYELVIPTLYQGEIGLEVNLQEGIYSKNDYDLYLDIKDNTAFNLLDSYTYQEKIGFDFSYTLQGVSGTSVSIAMELKDDISYSLLTSYLYQEQVMLDTEFIKESSQNKYINTDIELKAELLYNLVEVSSYNERIELYGNVIKAEKKIVNLTSDIVLDGIINYSLISGVSYNESLDLDIDYVSLIPKVYETRMEVSGDVSYGLFEQTNVLGILGVSIELERGSTMIAPELSGNYLINRIADKVEYYLDITNNNDFGAVAMLGFSPNAATQTLGVVKANSTKRFYNVKTEDYTISSVMTAYVKFDDGINVSDFTNYDVSYTPPTFMTWKFLSNKVGFGNDCRFDNSPKIIGTTCEVLGEIRTVRGSTNDEVGLINDCITVKCTLG